MMHKLTIILLTAMAAVSTNAQTSDNTYKKMLVPGRIWFYDLEYNYETDGRHEIKDYKIVFALGDTIVNNREAIKLKVIYHNVDEVTYLAAYEEDRRVYAQLQPDGDFELLMDFNATTGDKIDGSKFGQPDGRTLTVTEDQMRTSYSHLRTDNVHIATPHRILTVSDGKDTCYWIEGIGPANENLMVSSAPMEGARMLLRKCFDGYTTILEREMRY